MKMKWIARSGALVLLLACAMSASADDRDDYNRRAAARDLSLFHSLDRNGDGAVSRLEAQGDINFLPRFNDMEVDMDGIVTTAELNRYLELRYQVRVRPDRGQP
jgi:hypothetical protein